MSELRVILALVVANGIFAGSEIAVVALRRSRIQELADEGGGRARAVLKLRDHPERFLATVQVGITVVSLCLTAAGKVPSAGDVLTLDDGVTLEVVDATPRRVQRVRLRLPCPTAEETPE